LPTAKNLCYEALFFNSLGPLLKLKFQVCPRNKGPLAICECNTRNPNLSTSINSVRFRGKFNDLPNLAKIRDANRTHERSYR
jgi:hypothetical protein